MLNLRLSALLAVITILVLFAFPKAGVYAGNIPITVSYVLLGVVASLEAMRLLGQRARSAEPRYLWFAALLFGLGTVEVFSFCVYGSESLGAMVSILVTTLAIPVITILATHWMIRVLGIDRVLSTMRWALALVFVIGMTAFLAYNTTGRVLGIPFVTTTGSDIELVATKHNLRGPVIKMISTYNNGNILGISLLMWGPLAAMGAARAAVGYRSLCVLTLSRSVWAGLIALELVSALANRSLQRVNRAVLGAIMLIAAVVVASLMIGKDPTEFLLDKDLGGRLTNLQNDLEVISSRRIGWTSESLYAAAMLAFGPFGLMLLTCLLMVPVVSGGTTELQQVSRVVMVIYLLVASVEGAFTLVPTQAVYWFVAAIAMKSPQNMAADEQDDVESSTTITDVAPATGPRWRIAAASRRPSRIPGRPISEGAMR